jgi:Lysophospholipase
MYEWMVYIVDYLEDYLSTFDNTKLFYKKDTLDKMKGIILIVHGIAEHCGRYGYIKDKLIEEGYGVYRFDHRGHGKSEGKSGYVNSFKDFINDVDYFVDLIKREYPELPLFILGHSMGGFITSCYGVINKNKINGQILSGAVTGDIPLSMKIKSIKFPYILSGKVPNCLYNYISKNTQVIEDYKNDKLVLKFTSVRLNLEVSNKGVKWIKSNLRNYKCPCLILHGKDDNIVPYQCSTNFYENISSKDKEIKIYNGLYHEILNEDFKDNVLKDICDWLNERSLQCITKL